jgi:hypothetical protein
MNDGAIPLKPTYPINNSLADYLKRFDRTKVPVYYDDLLRFQIYKCV